MPIFARALPGARGDALRPTLKWATSEQSFSSPQSQRQGIVAGEFVLGWEEWLALPELDLPAIKAKVDTGAKTSSLHAFVIEPFGSPMRPMVRFGVHPIPGREDVEVFATAEVVDHREVTSSNGDREPRYVIRTTVRIGERRWPIELTLANRESMSYRMLLGRQAIQEDMLVDPAASFLQPRLSYRSYQLPRKAREDNRALSIALLTRRPENATNRRLQRVAETRGHTLRMIDRGRVSLFIDNADPAVLLDGLPVSCDALIVRPGRGTPTFSAAIARQLEMGGAVVLGSADAFIRASDAIAVRQCLAHAGVPVASAAVTHAQAVKGEEDDRHVLADSLTMRGLGPLVRIVVVGGRAVAAIVQEHVKQSEIDADPPWRPYDADDADALRRLAEQAAVALELEVAGLDMVVTHQGPVVIDVTVAPPLSLFERVTGAAVCEAIIVYIEQVAQATRERRKGGEID